MGELTQIVPFEMVDEVLIECGATQQRLRKLPARVVVYLLLAAALFEECGYPAVWSKLTGALGSLPLPKITATGLWHARCRLGVRPLRALFDLLRGPASAVRTAGARWAGLLVVAVDGTYLDVADDPDVRAKLGKGANQYTAASGYPQVLLIALVACGTRTVIDAVFGPRKPGEPVLGRRLMRSMRQGMVVLLDRGFATNAFLQAVDDTGADFLARLSAARKPPVLRRLDDGSFLSRIGTMEVRIIECEIAIADTTCTVPGTDPDRASFSVAFQTARDQVIQAANVFADTTVDLIGAIGRAVLEHLLPARRLRLSPRAVKRPMSRYAYKSLRVDRRTYKATISIDILLTQLISP
ncbi:transposase domain-containing protein [Streptomyces rapamycinicus]|uniref:transposase domain-containing protein n=1 Tax=Streptomyces rapamycinicus TaxID=1226757 RepID=UPI00237BA070|nr:transposase domain-containing protein [Streptomyces rapamycinicus]